MNDETENARQTEDEAVKRTLESAYCPEPIRQARQRQDQRLLERLGPHPLKIADIGCGNGYHAVHLSKVTKLYQGFEISNAIAETARELWKSEAITNAQIFVGDVSTAELHDEFYDVVLCLYFTPGNLRDKSDDLDLFTDEYLDRNPQFIHIVSRFLAAMVERGSMFLTVYQDVPEAEAAQIDYYKNTGQHVVTSPGSRFVATAEGFWSARWTKDSLRSNLAACGVGADNITFIELNEISWLVEITKN